jgi:hydrogenase expression/formation protein HypC
MCLAVPMRIISRDGHMARCEARGVRRDVSLTLLADQDLAIGDYGLVHVGYALQTIGAADAQATWALFDDISAVPYPSNAWPNRLLCARRGEWQVSLVSGDEMLLAGVEFLDAPCPKQKKRADV